MNIPESEDHNITTQDLIEDILADDLDLDTQNIRFHAVYRIGKPREGKTRPILARLVCRQIVTLFLHGKTN